MTTPGRIAERTHESRSGIHAGRMDVHVPLELVTALVGLGGTITAAGIAWKAASWRAIRDRTLATLDELHLSLGEVLATVTSLYAAQAALDDDLLRTLRRGSAALAPGEHNIIKFDVQGYGLENIRRKTEEFRSACSRHRILQGGPLGEHLAAFDQARSELVSAYKGNRVAALVPASYAFRDRTNCVIAAVGVESARIGYARACCLLPLLSLRGRWARQAARQVERNAWLDLDRAIAERAPAAAPADTYVELGTDHVWTWRSAEV